MVKLPKIEFFFLKLSETASIECFKTKRHRRLFHAYIFSWSFHFSQVVCTSSLMCAAQPKEGCAFYEKDYMKSLYFSSVLGGGVAEAAVERLSLFSSPSFLR